MIIPSIDLMGGKAVQLRQGKEHILTSDRDPVDLAQEFNRYGEVAVIDLDAALGRGDNLDLIRGICRVADVRIGGGIRNKIRGKELLSMGAARLMIGTAATPELLSEFPPERIIIALDHSDGTVLDKGWTRSTGEDLFSRAERLAPYCGAFLVTFVEDEGGMVGMNFNTVNKFKQQLKRPVTVAGGIADTSEVVALSKLNLDVQVGMALYTGKVDPVEAVIRSLDYGKNALIPTVVQDESGQILMVANSTHGSLAQALREGKGIYYSRSRKNIWEKGLTSGCIQQLLSCRTDCDRDTLLFTVKQTGVACHTGSYSCFGSRKFSLSYLFDVLKCRKREMPAGSFSAAMFKNRETLFDKIIEEANEVITAKSRTEYIHEIADLVFFLSVLAVDEEIEWKDIIAKLRGRNK